MTWRDVMLGSSAEIAFAVKTSRTLPISTFLTPTGVAHAVRHPSIDRAVAIFRNLLMIVRIRFFET
jgi:hypothetical protein